MGAPAVGDQVVVVGDEVDLAAPGPVVDRVALAERGHEVGGDGDARREPVQDVPFGHEVLAQGGVGEAAVVELLRRVADGGCGARRVDLLVRGVALAPERGAPGFVDRVEGSVRGAEPVAEVGGAAAAVAGADGDAVLVVHVPERERGVVAVAAGELGGDAGGGLAVGGGAVADRPARAEGVPHALAADRQRLGVGAVEPGGRRHGGCGQVDPDAVLVQQVEEPVEPAEVVPAGGGFQQGPGEDPDAHQGDAGLAHQPDVLLPHALRPLFGVVVPAEREPVQALRSGLRHGCLLGVGA